MTSYHERHQERRAELLAFADELLDAGFRVYDPGPSWTFLGFAREVDGQWCSGTVSSEDYRAFGAWSWSMRIIPSREYGSAMFLDDVEDGTPLSVETARAVTQPRASNSVIPERPNAGWPAHWGEGVTR